LVKLGLEGGGLAKDLGGVYSSLLEGWEGQKGSLNFPGLG